METLSYEIISVIIDMLDTHSRAKYFITQRSTYYTNIYFMRVYSSKMRACAKINKIKYNINKKNKNISVRNNEYKVVLIKKIVYSKLEISCWALIKDKQICNISISDKYNFVLIRRSNMRTYSKYDAAFKISYESISSYINVEKRIRKYVKSWF